ncbi:MAG: glycoside hydrolase/phage tail family protein [Pseudomonadota bacterium]
MTSILLSGAGSIVGGFLGGPLGALLGRAAGALVGNSIDQKLFGGGARNVEGPRLHDLDVQSSSEGNAIPKVYGRARIAGEVIWATRFEEEATTETSGAKAIGLASGLGGGPSTRTTNYTYFANFAVGLCEGPIAHIGRIWADGKPLARSGLTIRIYKGDETQEPDSLIQAKQGTPDVPAYRGLCYVVFERMPIAAYGNRLPQLTFEMIRPIGALEEQLRGVCLIPGATEFGYHTESVTRRGDLGASVSENAHSGLAATDFLASIDELQAVAQNLNSVSLIVPWYGTDLRLDHCLVKPGVDNAQKQTSGATWSVCGLSRSDSHVVSTVDGRAAYGGTPADVSIIAAIKELKDRELKVALTPFLLMDIAEGNTLPDPYTGETGQPKYPWRGRITCSPAPDAVGTPDGAGGVTTQINSFFGTAAPGDFTIDEEMVIYSGPAEFTYRRQVLHLAALAQAAGGVDVFVIGSELKGMTRLRSAAQTYPAIAALITLAADVREILGDETKITYAADWTEYGSYLPPGTDDVLFPLDALWADDNIDAVGIDFYAPLSDWRDEEIHLDGAIAATPYDKDYLVSRLDAGEAYDFYYADDEARAAQTRLPIGDGAYGKPWIYRPKDIKNWWLNAHHERISGVEDVSATAWAAQAKPVYLMEIGVPAVDLGANQPNIFPDPKSAEGGLPYGAQGRRDDAMQRRALEAIHSYYDPNAGEAVARNPVSTLYDAPMVETSFTHVWAWDARPWPAFPCAADVWGDGDNWRTGHWLNGRLGAAPADRLVEKLCADFSGPNVDASALDLVATGYVVDRPMSGRAALEPLGAAFGFDIMESAGVLTCKPYAALPPEDSFDSDAMARDGDDELPRVTRAQETELPRAVQFTVTDADMDFRRSTVNARLADVATDRELGQEFALIMCPADAQSRAETLIHQIWVERESVKFALPLSKLDLEAGDLVTVQNGNANISCRVTRIEIDRLCRIEAKRVEAQPCSRGIAEWRSYASARTQNFGAPYAVIMDLPALPGDDAPHRPYLAATASPWPGRLTVAQKKLGSFVHVADITRRAIIGTTSSALNAGPVWLKDNNHHVDVVLSTGTLSSIEENDLFSGGNSAAVQHADGAWEIIQFQNAELIGEKTYRLSTLLRGQLGTEHLSTDTLDEEALFVFLDGAQVSLPVSLDDIGRETQWRVAPEGAPATYSELIMTPAGVGLLPYAPVQPRMSRTAEGVTFTFQRRTRANGDSWELAEVPLNETAEAYEIDILDDDVVKRTLSVSSPTAFYTNSDETADFGTVQTNLHIRIAQRSETLGRGRVLDAVVTP